MKRVLLAVAFAALLVLGSTMVVAAQPGTWVSGITIQNQDTDHDAEITVEFYWAEDGQAHAGTLAHTFTDTVKKGGSKTYYVPSDPKTQGLPSGFVGSAVVTSKDYPVAAIVNTQVPTSGAGNAPDNPNRVGTASGVLSPANTQYCPQVMKQQYGGKTGEYWNSYIAVQNTSGSDATVSIKYYRGTDGQEVTAAAQSGLTIRTYSTRIFRQAENAGLPDGFSGSAVVSGNQPLAAVTNFYNSAVTHAAAQFHSYNGFGAGATKLYAPRVLRNYYDYQSGITVQNIGTAATDVTITYTFDGYAPFSQTWSAIPAGASKGNYLPTDPAVTAVVGANSVKGSAVIESSGQPIVAIVNEDNRVGLALANQEGRGVTYGAVPAGSATTAVLFPQVTARIDAWSGGVQVQNVSAEDAEVVITFSTPQPGFSDVTLPARTIAAGSSFEWFAPSYVAKGFNGSATVVCTNGKLIVGTANNSKRPDVQAADAWPPNYGDSYLTYNGINK